MGLACDAEDVGGNVSEMVGRLAGGDVVVEGEGERGGREEIGEVEGVHEGEEVEC